MKIVYSELFQAGAVLRDWTLQRRRQGTRQTLRADRGKRSFGDSGGPAALAGV